MKKIYDRLKEFKSKYPLTIAWRIKKHAKILEEHINEDEEVLYTFAAQKNDNPFDIVTTYGLVLTNKRILIASKRLLFGYFYTAITPDMFNDLTIKMGLIWGKVYIDTVKEVVKFSNIQREALAEIETAISSYMLDAKKKYQNNSEEVK